MDKSFQPNVLGSMWRYRWLVLGSVVLWVAFGFLYHLTRAPTYLSTASLVVEDPRATGVFQAPTGNPERYVTDQMLLLESTVVAERAAELAGEQLPSLEIGAQRILRQMQVLGNPESNVIEVSFQADDPQVAQVVTESIVAAYQELRRSEAVSSSAAALEQLDSSLRAIDEELASVRAELGLLRDEPGVGNELNAQLVDALSRLLALWRERTTTTDTTRLSQIDQEVAQVSEEIQTLAMVQDLSRQSPELTTLVREHEAILDRRLQLEQRRDQIIVDAELTSGGVVVLSPALPGEETGPGLDRIVAAAVVLGLLTGGGFSYVLAQQSRTFSGRSEPELVLNAPLLAEVPVFADEGIKSQLPVRTHKLSASAESFRFAAAAIDIQAKNAKVLIAVSAVLGEGKTTVVANTAMAVASKGHSVLVVDADFGDQALSRLLLNGSEVDRGLTELVEENIELAQVLRVVTHGGSADLGLIGRGKGLVTAPDFFRSAGAQSFFSRVREKFDLVLVDAPPLLQVAYASSIARYADAALVIVPHGSEVHEFEEVAARLAYIGIPIAGYIYNHAPLRPELVTNRKSTRNILGTGTPPEPRPRGARHKS